MNILFVSHCDFTGNSAMHLFSIAEALRRHGVDSVICVPNDPSTIHQHRGPLFQVLHHEEAMRWGALFPDGRGPDLIHAWTPRELVRVVTEKLVQRYCCQYIVHLEDNERAVLMDEIGEEGYSMLSRLSLAMADHLVPSARSHPNRSETFMAGAAGMTVLMDRLLEFKPEHVPGMVFWPGFDLEFLSPSRSSGEMRKELGLAPDEIALVYNGNIHHSNQWEASSLVLAVCILNRKGRKVKLVKTGWNYVAEDIIRMAADEGCLINLGFVARETISSLLSMADILVQPGRPNEFNDYRFPSKLPEFLASGKPVILPRSNVGRFLTDGTNCLLLNNGDALEIAGRIEELIADPALRKRLGSAGRDFATTRLLWSKNVDSLFDFYSKILAGRTDSIAGAVVLKPRAKSELPVKLIAFYLPQFHPIQENDEWWGKGFTEWSNVTAAKPVFPGHHQPQLPTSLGFYDLRVPEVMQEQAELAARYGVHGFCLYYYWFNGKKLLDLPLNQMLASGKPNFPFCLCWANENWTRAWDGAEKEILIEQVYSDEADESFIRELIPIFKDERYIRVNDAPLLLIYRVTAMPDAAKTAQRWRKICAQEGIPALHLAAVQSFGFLDPRPYGFDSAVEFPPHVTRYLLPEEVIPGLAPDFQGYLEDYAKVARHQVQEQPVDYVRYRGVIPAWDNSARRGNRAHIMIRSSPDLYEKWLRAIVEQTLLESGQEPLVFINAWNEWAEGTHLEPDQKYGMAYLDATRHALSSGVSSFFGRRQLAISEKAVESIIDSVCADRHLTADDKTSTVMRTMKKTENWFDDRRLEQIYKDYGKLFQLAPVSYATVRDYCNSFDQLNPLATSNGDLKDVQRPWVLKAILGRVPRGGRLLEIGAGEPFVADLLSRLGYEVWVVDPYDGSGNGPLDYERFSAQCPDVRFIRAQFGDQLLQLPEQSLDCVYSISVLEHIPPDGLLSVAAGMRKFLKRDGVSIHAVDHVHRGDGAVEHLRNLELMVDLFGLSSKDLHHQLELVNQDPETYFLSAESHNRWRGSVPYRQFPMRVCVSVQLVSEAAGIRKSSNDALQNTEIVQNAAAPARQISLSNKSENLIPGDFSWAVALNDQQWLEFLAGVKQIDGRRAPKLPPADIQRKFVGSDGVTALQEAARFFQCVKRIVSQHGGTPGPHSKVLDFGVGWGRLYRILLRDFAPKHLIGVDVDSKAIEMCKEAIPYGSFLEIPSSPPYGLRTGEFDLILLYSVFSHLSESAFTAILVEFERILKPGGFVAFTTLKKAHLEIWAQRASQPYWRDHLEHANFDAVLWRERAAAGEFLFVPTGGGDPSRPADFYGEAIITEAFLRKVLTKHSLEVSHFSESGDAPQALAVLRRK